MGFPSEKGGSGLKSWPRHEIVRETIGGVDLLIYRERPSSVPEMFYRSVDANPHHLALVFNKARWSYASLEEAVNRVARTLRERWGVAKGDRVAAVLHNCPEFVILYLAVGAVGGILVPLNARLKGRELLFQIQRTEPLLLFVSPETWPEVEPIRGKIPSVRGFISVGGDLPESYPWESLLEGPPAFRPSLRGILEEDLCTIFFTSGTTGLPKGVMLNHRNVVNTAMACARVFNATAEDVDLIMVPLFHVTGLFTQLTKTLYLGGTTVLMGSFKAEEALRVMEEHGVTMSVSVPTIYWLMLISPSFSQYRLESFRKIVYGGAPAAPELIERLYEAFPGATLINAGGLTEGTSLQYALPPEDALRKAGSVGFPTPCTECRIVDEQGRDVPVGEVGELILKGAGVAMGYWKDPESTRKTFREGWLYTGDLARIDEEGYLWLMDRKKDMIIRGGENIYSVEVENVLYAFPKTLEAAVVGVPDRIFGEEVKAYVVLKEGEMATEEEIRSFCAQQLADYKVPRYIEIRSDPLPRNPGGKVMKDLLREGSNPYGSKTP